MKTPFSWRHIEIFHAVMTTQNLTEAADLLKTSQPTVSRELSRLEQLLSFKLFDRIKGRLQPTTEGLRFLKRYSALIMDLIALLPQPIVFAIFIKLN